MRLHRIEQSGVASSTKEPHNLNERESVKLKESVKNGKQEPRIHHQTRHSPNSHALFATDSLDLKLAYTAINKHTNDTITQQTTFEVFSFFQLSTLHRRIPVQNFDCFTKIYMNLICLSSLETKLHHLSP